MVRKVEVDKTLRTLRTVRAQSAHGVCIGERGTRRTPGRPERAPSTVRTGARAYGSAPRQERTRIGAVELRFRPSTARGTPVGETHHRARYSDKVVAAARARYADGERVYFIALDLGVPRTTVSGWVHTARRTQAPARVIVSRHTATPSVSNVEPAPTCAASGQKATRPATPTEP